MPIKNGLEATREIRVLPRRDAKNVHILAMSANAFESDIQECIKQVWMDISQNQSLWNY